MITEIIWKTEIWNLTFEVTRFAHNSSTQGLHIYNIFLGGKKGMLIYNFWMGFVGRYSVLILIFAARCWDVSFIFTNDDPDNLRLP